MNIKKPIIKLSAKETRLGIEAKGKKEVRTMPTVRVMFENSKYNYSTSVSVNVTKESAKKYFVGKMFNVGSYPKEVMRKCVSIRFTPANKK